MDVKIDKSLAKGEISALPAKSLLHRYLIAASMVDDDVELSFLEPMQFGLDVSYTIRALANFHKKCVVKEKSLEVKASDDIPQNNYFCGSSASTLRFLIPLSLVFSSSSSFTCSDRLMERGIDGYDDLFKKANIKVIKKGNSISLTGKMLPGSYVVAQNKSSQYLTGLLFALPLLKKDSYIMTSGPEESEGYARMTLYVLKQFGIKIIKKESCYYIPGNQSYKKGNFVLEGDYSSASFFAAFNFLQGDVKIRGLKADSLQGDAVYRTYFPLLKNGCPTLDIRNAIDLGPILIALASLFNGCKITGYRRLKIKESDRIGSLKAELKKFGVILSPEKGQLTVNNSKLHKPNCVLFSHDDHRIAMALAVMLTQFGGVITHAEAVSKSYPEFFSDLKQLGIKVDES